MRLLIDTDPGVDDALAILMALAQPDVQVEGLTIAAGNVGLAQTTANALKLLEVSGRDVPVFPGCAHALVQSSEGAAFVHGRDGFGDTGLPAAQHRRAQDEHAALAMLRLADRYPGEMCFVMLGPLTNLALALRLDPRLPDKVPRLLIMGGAVSGRGNTTVSAEFNIGFDPEAAHVVFSGWPRFELVDWEATVAHGMAHEWIDACLERGGACARFYAAISRKTREFGRRRHPLHFLAADALAMAVVLRPDLLLESAERHVEVELSGRLTRGATVVDWDARSGYAANARIARRVDQRGFEALVEAALRV